MSSSISDVSAGSSAEFLSRAAILVAVKTQDAAKQQGDAAIKLMEQALELAKAQPKTFSGSGIDLRA